MEDSLANEDLQFRIKVVSLFKSGGWKLVEEKLYELRECYVSELQLLMADCVNNEKLALLNMRLGKVQALNAVLAIKDELLEQITPEDGDTTSEANQED